MASLTHLLCIERCARCYEGKRGKSVTENCSFKSHWGTCQWQYFYRYMYTHICMHACMHTCWGMTFIIFSSFSLFWDHVLSFGGFCNLTFSIFNNILSAKCWQPNQGSLECFWNDTGWCNLKVLANADVVKRAWALGADRHRIKSGFNYLLTMQPWESFLTLRIYFSAHNTENPRRLGKYTPVEVLMNVIAHLRNILCVCTCVYLHHTRYCMGNRKPLFLLSRS